MLSAYSGLSKDVTCPISKFSIFQHSIYVISKKTLPKSACPIESFTLPGPSGNELCYHINVVCLQENMVTLERYFSSEGMMLVRQMMM